MKGLVIKDLKLLSKNNSSVFIMIIIVAFITLQSKNYAFIITYVTILAGMLPTNTIVMDENGRSMPFLMTMPVTRELYVVEKYILMIVGSLLGTSLSTLICMAMNVGKFREIFMYGSSAFITMSIYNMITIPLQLKFKDKARIALLCITAGIVVAVMACNKMAAATGSVFIGGIFVSIKNFFISLIDAIMSQNKLLVGLTALIGWLACLTLSYLISRRIIRKKEF